MLYKQGEEYKCKGVRPIDLPLDTPIMWKSDDGIWCGPTTAGRLRWGKVDRGVCDVVTFRVLDTAEVQAELSKCDRELTKFLDEEKVLPFQRGLVKRAWYTAWDKANDS